ncbi:MAG: Uncharacterised protein [Owenweeksia sp. TMED14]|nr:MAG: Uncharacterised protein [Owenweeksia sp. TMED14]|tara:strand:- start:4362 stop:5327 length:966 start_codon:yes stop_codon:yes gene_type:complete
MKRKKISSLLFFVPTILLSQPVSFCVGSCADLNNGKNEKIFTIIANQEPEFFLWLGDNIYSTEEHWGSFKSMKKAYQDRHSTEEIAKMFNSVKPQYAIWDDHDYGPNDADSSFFGKKISARVFESVWTDTPTEVSKYGDTRWSLLRGDIGIIGLDDRSHRGQTGSQVLGNNQLKWLEKTINRYNEAKIIFIALGSQILNEAKVYENYSRFPQERSRFLEICSNSNSQIVLLSGDRHHGELNVKKVNGKRIIEITSSPLTSSTHSPSKDELKNNHSLVRGSVIDLNHFNRINWDGDSTLSTDFLSSTGKVLLSKEWTIQTNF